MQCSNNRKLTLLWWNRILDIYYSRVQEWILEIKSKQRIFLQLWFDSRFTVIQYSRFYHKLTQSFVLEFKYAFRSFEITDYLNYKTPLSILY